MANALEAGGSRPARQGVLRLPRSLPEPRRAGRLIVFAAWWFCLFFALFAQAGTSWRVWLFQEQVNPVFSSLGFYIPYPEDRDWVAQPFAEQTIEAGLQGGQRILRINGRPLPEGTTALTAARLVEGSPSVRLSLRSVRTGALWHVILEPSEKTRAEVYRAQVRWYSIATHLVDLAIALALIAVACVLRWRRQHDLTANLISIALLLIATLGCWRLWDWLGLPASRLEVSLNGIWLGLLLVAVPALPSGRYLPEGARWFLLLGPAFALLLILNPLPMLDSIITAAGGAALLAVTAVRMGRTPRGGERHRISWALLGVAAGVLLWLPGGSVEANFWTDLPPASKVFVFVSTRCGLLILALSLMMSILAATWEGEVAVRLRSAGYATVMVMGTGIWAAAGHYAKEVVRSAGEVVGTPLALAISAMIGVALVGPLRKRLTGWVDAQFRGELNRLAALADEFRAWEGCADPSLVAQRALKRIVEVSGAEAAALLRPAGNGGAPEVLAIDTGDRNSAAAGVGEAKPDSLEGLPVRIEAPDGPDLPLILLLGRRHGSDYYSKEERRALAASLDALMGVIRRAARDAAIRDSLSGIVRSLRRLAPQP